MMVKTDVNQSLPDLSLKHTAEDATPSFAALEKAVTFQEAPNV